ncbi:IclR family transcriptional regulator [Halostagnicola bangensis]
MTPNVPLSTVGRAFEIIEFVRNQDGATIAEITETLELPKSTVHDYVNTLSQLGYLTNDNGTYDLSLRFLTHGRYVQKDIALGSVVRPYLEDLASKTGEIVWYIVEEDGKAVYVQKATGNDALQPYASIGTRCDLHSIAGGKAILAALPDDYVDRVIEERGLDQRTDRTITSPGELEESRDRIAERGYALNRGENIDGWRAVASSIVVNDDLYGAIAVAGPENRLRDDRFETTIPELTTGTANEIQLQLRSSDVN